MGFEFYLPVEVYFGNGVLSRAGEIGRRFGFRTLVVTGRESAKRSGALDRLVNSLRAAGVEEVFLYDAVRPNPTDQMVNEGADLAVRKRIDFIVGLGGGSVLDTAKAISLVSSNEGSAWDYVRYPEGSRLVPYLSRPVICVPTTAGTGSEVNRFSVITNPLRREKLVISHSLNYPKAALVDPELTLSMDPELTAVTGFDALIHALEALTNKRSNPIAESFAVQAIEIIARWLPTALEEPENLKAREMMSYASLLAGIALDQLGVALIHALEHPVSAHYPQIAHGKGLAPLAVPVTEFNLRGNPEGYALFARLMGYRERASDAVRALEDMVEKLRLPLSLKELGVEESLLGRLAEDACRLSGRSVEVNPVKPSPEDIEKLYRKAYFP